MSASGRKRKKSASQQAVLRTENSPADTESPRVIEGYSADYRDVQPQDAKGKEQQDVPQYDIPDGEPEQTNTPEPQTGNPPVTKQSIHRQEEPVYVELPMDKELLDGEDTSDEEDSPEPDEIIWMKDRAAQLKSALHSDVPKKRGRRRYGVVVGSLVLLFALVGVSFLATVIGQAIHQHLTDDSALREYDKLISPVVMQDPVPFETVEGADPEMVMTASLWRAISNAGAQNFTAYDDKGRSLVSLGLVDNACHELFGPDCKLQPKSPAQETFFDFDSTDNQFHISPYSDQSSFAPYTESVKKSGDSLILRVGYVSAVDEYRTASGASKPVPVKYMEYVLKTNSQTGKKYVYAVRTITG